jgi:hypothetical protein
VALGMLMCTAPRTATGVFGCAGIWQAAAGQLDLEELGLSGM